MQHYKSQGAPQQASQSNSTWPHWFADSVFRIVGTCKHISAETGQPKTTSHDNVTKSKLANNYA